MTQTMTLNAEARSPADEAAAEPLCDSRALEERGKAWVWDVLEFGQPARAFALRFDGQVRAYMNRCLHVPTEMDWQPGEFLDSDKRFIICSVHGATYEPEDGQCVGGPCGRGRLKGITTKEREGQVYWYPSRDVRPIADVFESAFESAIGSAFGSDGPAAGKAP
jgi:nitrite reductase/ring-hydroxylating ferredoxin subunit